MNLTEAASSVVAALKDAAAVTNPAQNRKKLKKKLEIVKRKSEFPVKIREAIEDAIEESPQSFLRTIESKLLDLLWDNFKAWPIDATKGLNCDRDTEAEVEVAIRFFPNVLSYDRYHGGYYPIYAQFRNFGGDENLKAASFIPLFAKLGIELGQFEEEERGGLTGRRNMLKELAVNAYC